MKTLKLIVILIGSAFLSISCNEGGNNTPLPPTTIAPVVPVKAPSMIIPVQEAEDMYHRYKTDHISVIEKVTNVDENKKAISPGDEKYVRATTSISFDYKELKNYLAFIEQEAKEANTDITALRVYFSKYANTQNDGRSTVFLNPTMKYGGPGITDDVSFAIHTKGKTKIAIPVAECFKVPLIETKSLTEDKTESETKAIITTGVQSLAGNRGGWRPPPPLPNDPDYQ